MSYAVPVARAVPVADPLAYFAPVKVPGVAPALPQPPAPTALDLMYAYYVAE